MNESGKTNILRALRLIDPLVPSTDSDIRNPLEDEEYPTVAEVDFVYKLSEADHANVYEALLKTTLVLDPNTPFCEINGKQCSLKDFVNHHDEAVRWDNVLRHVKSDTAYRKSSGVRILPGWVQRSVALPEEALTDWEGQSRSVNSAEIIYAPDYSLAISKLEALTADAASTIVSARIGLLLKEYKTPCILWTYSEANLLPSSIEIQPFCENPDMCMPLKHMFSLAGIGPTDIKRVMERERAKGPNALRNLLEKVAQRSTKHIAGIWKECKGLKVQLELNGAQIDASVLDSFNRYNFADRSDGFKRFVSFLLLVSARARSHLLSNHLLLIDEPEIGLHPSGVRYLRDELLKIAYSNIVVVSTHSIFMVDRDNIGRHILVSKEKEVTQTERAQTTNIVEEEVIYNALGYSIFENLQEVNFVFEGWRDKRLFDVACSKAGARARRLRESFRAVGKCHLQGLGDLGRVAPLIELGRRKYFVLSDDDAAARHAKTRFRGAGQFFTFSDISGQVREITAEDFVAETAFRTVIEATRAAHTNLASLQLVNEPVGIGKVETMRRWLSAGGVTGDENKSVLNQIKESVFESLTASDVLDSYLSYLENLATKLQQVQAAE